MHLADRRFSFRHFHAPLLGLAYLVSSQYSYAETQAEPAEATPAESTADQGSAPAAQSEQAPSAATAPIAAADTQPAVAPAEQAPAEQAPAPLAQPSEATAWAPSEPLSARELLSPKNAYVEIKVNYPNAWLELRSVIYGGEWRKVCEIPCGKTLEVDGMDARVRAPGMTPTNIFRIQPGIGTARIQVKGGSELWGQVGFYSIALGLPVLLGSGAAYGYGFQEQSQPLQTGGIVGMVVSGVAIVASLPMLLMSATSVRDYDGKLIGKAPQIPGRWVF